MPNDIEYQTAVDMCIATEVGYALAQAWDPAYPNLVPPFPMSPLLRKQLGTAERMEAYIKRMGAAFRSAATERLTDYMEKKMTDSMGKLEGST